MPKRIKPTGRQKMIFLVHFIIFLAASATMLLTYDKGSDEWVYPWPAWPVAAWALAVLGHWSVVYRSYEDHGMEQYHKDAANG